MRRRIALLFRKAADWLAPEYPAVTALMPLAREVVTQTAVLSNPGSIKWLIAMKIIRGRTKAKLRHINAAIDRAVLEQHGD